MSLFWKKIKEKIRRGLRIIFVTLPFLVWLGCVFFYIEVPSPKTVLLLLLALFGVGIIAVGVVVYEIMNEASTVEDKITNKVPNKEDEEDKERQS